MVKKKERNGKTLRTALYCINICIYMYLYRTRASTVSGIILHFMTKPRRARSLRGTFSRCHKTCWCEYYHMTALRCIVKK